MWTGDPSDWGAPNPTQGCRWSLLWGFRTWRNCKYEASGPVRSSLPAAWATLLPVPIPILQGALPCPPCPFYLLYRDPYHLHGQMVRFRFPWSPPPAVPAGGGFWAQSLGHQQRGRWTAAVRPEEANVCGRRPGPRRMAQVCMLPASALRAWLHCPASCLLASALALI